MIKVACIGSRNISPEIEEALFAIGRVIAFRNWEVLSGNADGSDSAFARGANSINPNKVELYLPWETYNLDYIATGNRVVFDMEPEWCELAREHHPIYDRLTQGVKKLMDRNAGIIVNSDIVIAYLPNGEVKGGTAHGWKIAGALNKPRIDVSALEKGMKIDEIFDWMRKSKEKLEKRLTGV